MATKRPVKTKSKKAHSGTATKQVKKVNRSSERFMKSGRTRTAYNPGTISYS